MADTGTIYTLDIAQAEAALDKLGAGDLRLRQQIEASIKQSNQGYLAAAQAVTGYSDRLGAAADQQRGAQAATRDAMRAVQELAQANRDLATAQRASSNGAETERLGREIAKNTAKIREAKQAILENKLATDQERLAVEAVREARRQEVNQTKLAAAAARDAAAAAKEGAAATKDAGGPGFFGNLLTRIGAAGVGLLAFNKLFDQAKDSIGNFAALSGAQATFRAVAGNAEDGAKAFAFVKNQANALGLELIPTAKAYSQLFAAAKEANLPIAETENIFKGVTSAAKVLNISQAETESALRAVQQMLSKGTVSSQELRLQLGNALPGAFGLAAKAAGLTTQEFSKQVEQGNILAKDFLPKFARQLQLTYGAGTEEASQNVRANLGRINTFFQESSAKIGAFLAPAVAALANFVGASQTAAQRSDSLAGSFTKQNEGLKQLQQTVTPLVARYDALSSITSRNATEQKELDAVMQQLAKTVPGAVTQFDAYGKALGINSAAVRQFVLDQENLVRYNNKENLTKNSGALRGLLQEQRQLQAELNNTFARDAPQNAITGKLDQSFKSNQERLRLRPFVPGQVNTGEALLSSAESKKITEELTARLARVQDDVRGNLANRQILRGKSPLLPTGDPAANDAAMQGLIAKQEQLITAIKARQKQVSTTESKQPGGAAFLLGLGGLDEQLDKAEKELNRLLGKVDKGRKARDRSYESELRALLAERATLTALAAKAAIKTADDATTLARVTFEEQLRQVDAVKAKLEQRERDLARAARKAGGGAAVAGLGERADGQVDGVQAQQLTNLRLAALDTYYTALYKITAAREQRLFDLRADSDQKEVEAIDRKYDALVAKAKDGIERQAIAEAQQREQVALRQRQQQGRIDQTAAVATARAGTAGELFGTGTGVSVIEAKRAEKKALLEIEQQHARDTLNNTLLLGGKEGELARAQTVAALARIKTALAEVEREKRAHAPEDFIYKLIFGEQDSPALRAALDEVAASVLSSLSQITQAQQQAAAAQAGTATQNINELQSHLSAEIQLNKEGAASNIAGLQAQIAEQKQVRKEALDEQRKAAQAQVVIDTLTQASSIATAAANVFATFSAIPFVGVPLGIAAAGLLVGAFIAAKAKAFDAASQIGKGGSFFRGGFTGEGDPREESRAVGARPYTYHKGEYVMPHDVTADYRYPLLKPLHEGRPQDIDWAHPKMQGLLPDLTLPGRLRAERAEAHRIEVEHSFAPMQAKFDALHAELAEIKASNRQMADQPTVIPLGDNRTILERDPTTGSRTIRKL